MAQVNLLVNDLTKIVGTGEPLRAKLTNASDTPLTGKDIKFTINGVSYTRVTAADGVASLNINLPIGDYPVTVKFEGDSSYSSITREVTVHVTPKKNVGLLATDFSKTYGEKKAVSVEVYENLGVVPITGKDLKFTINGVTYTRTSNNKGVASLNINLPVGEYRCVVDSPEDSTHQSAQVNFMVRVKADTHMDGTNIVKMEDETVVYQCAVYTPWARVMDCTVDITVNGVTYTRQTDSNGLAKLNIRLPTGEYDLVASYRGDKLHNPSSVRNHISSKKRMQELTTIRNGVWYPGDNTGFVESHVMVKQWSPEVAKAKEIIFWDDINMKFHKDIPFTSYEITETDPRVKTAKFTTKEYFDLTAGILWVYISSPYHENFGGKILKADYDKDKGLYTYQCQDGRRNYLNKFKDITTNSNTSIYNHLRMVLMSPLFPDPSSADANEMNKYVNHKLLSGLRPLDAYNLEQVGIKAQNSYKNKPGESLSYDSAMDKIMNYSHINGTPVDVYFTPEGVCQIEPINVKTWLKSGFKITHTDLASYKYGFDTTNILTGVNVQTPQEGFVLKNADNRIFNNESVGLSYYFGGNIGMISPVTKQVEGEASTNSTGGSSTGGSSTATGANKGKTVVVGCDRNNGNDWALQDAVISKLQSAGYATEELEVYSNAFANYDWHGPAKGKVGVYLMASSTFSIADAMSSPGHGFDYYVFANRDNELGRGSISGWNSKPWGRDGDCNSVCNGWAGLTSAQIVEKMGSRGTMVYGDGNAGMANAVLAAVNGESTTAGSNGDGEKKTTTTVVDEVATYNKALEELSKSVRDLLSFEIKLPLNHPMFKEMHTNQFLWTELPREFKLGNLSEIFKIMASYKQNRGVSYVENRWYIEKMVVKCDSNGLFATLTLNVFPSPYSVYSNALKGYRDAYDQAFKQKEEQKNSGTSSGGGAGQARLGNDSTDTNSMACATGRYRGHAGDNENFDNCAKKGYAQEGKAYYNWARQYKSPIELAKAMANRFSYQRYWDNQKSVDSCHNNGGTIHCNCYDACRLVKVCFDAAGFDCIVVTGSIYEDGHGWNAVKHNGRWYTFDLTYAQRGSEWPGTNSLRCCNEW